MFLRPPGGDFVACNNELVALLVSIKNFEDNLVVCFMLFIVTDIPDPRWLIYILEEFSRLNRAEFLIQVTSQHMKVADSHIISYTTAPVDGICIPNRSQIQPSCKTLWFSEKLFVLDGTTSDDTRYALKYDLLWNAFVFLSRLEEYQSEIQGKKIQSYAFNHPREDKSTFDIPVVNHLFNELEHLIRGKFPDLTFKAQQSPVIEYSHDVDYIQKTLQLRLKQTAFNGFNTLKNILHPSACLRQTKKTITFLFSNPAYWCFEYWEELEKQYQVRSIFYVYASLRRKGLKSWILDPSYDISTHRQLQEMLQHLLKEDFEVGLHGSFDSATNETLLSGEKAILEEIVNTEVVKVRQHWLRYEERITPYLHNRLFQYDSTVGWNDRLGFRSGCASRYRPYDHENQQAFQYMVTPQMIMDSNIFDYGAKNIRALQKQALQLWGELRQFKSACVAISWHQRVCSSDYNWQTLYEEILNHEIHEIHEKTRKNIDKFSPDSIV